ncbi:leucine-rich repeat-containing protein 55 [Huso huso]|uniref:Leucine-rich repeat-containing protein 55 n=1 Tax=Huso huso TaxID=61971 RepID=A0ABR0Y7K5_HUSHU
MPPLPHHPFLLLLPLPFLLPPPPSLAWAPPSPLLLLLLLTLAPPPLTCGGGGGPLSRCPQLCNCTLDLTGVDCGSLALSSPPSSPPPLPTQRYSLSHNRISELPDGYFHCSRELRWLDLSNNSLSWLPAGLFRSQSQLRFLDLSRNNLSLLPGTVFHPAGALGTLRLSHNPLLSELDPLLFRGLPELRSLDLSHCGLPALGVQALAGLEELESLRLEGNPWLCGCGIEPLVEWVRSHVQRCSADSDLFPAECRAPQEMEGVPVFSLTEESFQSCRFSLSLDDYLFIAFVGFLVSIASVATNFLLGITANCCHRWSKASEEEDI